MIAEAKTGSKEVKDYVGTTSGYKQCTGIAHPVSITPLILDPLKRYISYHVCLGRKNIKIGSFSISYQS